MIQILPIGLLVILCLYPRGSPNANFVNGILYVIGGDSYDHSLVQVEAYDPLTEQWTSLAPVPTARHHVASAVVDGNIYVMGLDLQAL